MRHFSDFQSPTNADLTCSVVDETVPTECQEGVTLIKQTQDECVCFRLLASVGAVWIGFKGTGIMMVIVSVWKKPWVTQMFQKPPCFFNACVQSNRIAAIFRLVHTETAFRPEGANELLAPLAPVFAQPRRKAIRYEVTRCCQHLSIALAYSPPSWSPYMTDDSWGDNNPMLVLLWAHNWPAMQVGCVPTARGGYVNVWEPVDRAVMDLSAPFPESHRVLFAAFAVKDVRSLLLILQRQRGETLQI